MGATDILRAGLGNATEFLNRVLGRANLSEDDDDRAVDPDLAWAMQAEEDLRTGKNRMLTTDEQRRFVDRIRHGRK